VQLLNALDTLGVKYSDLITHMDTELDIKGGKQLQSTPVSMIYSVLNLTLRQVKLIVTPTVLTQKEQDDSSLLNEQAMITNAEHYRSLFKTSVWLCNNSQNFFSRGEQISLLKLVA